MRFFLFHILYISYCTQFKRRNYKLTEEERIVVEMLLMDVDAKSRQAKIYSEVADKTLESLRSDVESYQNSDVKSYKRKQGVSGWTVFRWGAAGAGLGALGKRESLREFYRGHFCLGNLRFYTSVHKGRLHQQVCRAT